MTHCSTCNNGIIAHRYVTGLKAYCSKACQCRAEGSGHEPTRWNKKKRRFEKNFFCSNCHAPEIPQERKRYRGKRK